MAIYTISGDKIEKVIDAEEDERYRVWLVCKMSCPDKSGGYIRELGIANLYADGGIKEIRQAIKQVNPKLKVAAWLYRCR